MKDFNNHFYQQMAMSKCSGDDLSSKMLEFLYQIFYKYYLNGDFDDIVVYTEKEYSPEPFNMSLVSLEKKHEIVVKPLGGKDLPIKKSILISNTFSPGDFVARGASISCITFSFEYNEYTIDMIFTTSDDPTRIRITVESANSFHEYRTSSKEMTQTHDGGYDGNFNVGLSDKWIGTVNINEVLIALVTEKFENLVNNDFPSFVKEESPKGKH